MNDKIRIFIDMDGTLCQWKASAMPEDLYEKGFYLSMIPDLRMLALAHNLLRQNELFDVYILSAVLEDSAYAEDEKRAWLDRHIPAIDDTHRIFCKCGTSKTDVVPGGLRSTDVLLDDYTVNLRDWHEHGGLAVKVFNGVNGTKGTWTEDLPSLPESMCSAEATKYLKTVIDARVRIAEVENKLEIVARIEWLNNRGEVANTHDYTTAAEFEKNVKEELHYGVPISVVIYRTKDGQTIPYDFIHQLDTLPKGLRVEAASKTRKAQPKTWMIPCVWQCFGVMDVEAYSLSEAITKARDEMGLPGGEYIQDSFEVDMPEEDIRAMYNDGQPDVEEE